MFLVITSSSSMMSSSMSRPAARMAPRGSRRNHSAFFAERLVQSCNCFSTWLSRARRRSGFCEGVLRRCKFCHLRQHHRAYKNTCTREERLVAIVYYLDGFGKLFLIRQIKNATPAHGAFSAGKAKLLIASINIFNFPRRPAVVRLFIKPVSSRSLI